MGPILGSHQSSPNNRDRGVSAVGGDDLPCLCLGGVVETRAKAVRKGRVACLMV